MSQKRFTIGITAGGAYDPTVTYKALVRVYDATTDCSYISKKKNNTGNPVTTTEWWQKDKSDPRMPVQAQTNSTLSINPNILHRWASAVTELNLTLLAGTGNGASEYMLEFTVSGNLFELNFASDVRWAGGAEPEWEDGWTYQVSILNGLAVAAGWEAAQS